MNDSFLIVFFLLSLCAWFRAQVKCILTHTYTLLTTHYAQHTPHIHIAHENLTHEHTTHELTTHTHKHTSHIHKSQNAHEHNSHIHRLTKHKTHNTIAPPRHTPSPLNSHPWARRRSPRVGGHEGVGHAPVPPCSTGKSARSIRPSTATVVLSDPIMETSAVDEELPSKRASLSSPTDVPAFDVEVPSKRALPASYATIKDARD